MESNFAVLPDSIKSPKPSRCHISRHFRMTRTSIGSSTFDKIPFNVDQLDRFYDKTMACSQCMATFGDDEWDTEGYQILAMKCPSKKKYFAQGLCHNCAMIKEGTIEKVIPTTTKPVPKSTTRNDRQTRKKSSEILFKIVQDLKDQCDLDDDRWIERVWDEMRVLLASTGSDFQKRHPEINFKKIQKPSYEIRNRHSRPKSIKQKSKGKPETTYVII